MLGSTKGIHRFAAALAAFAIATAAAAQPSTQALQEAWAAHQARLQAELPGFLQACGPGDDSRYREARNLVYAGEDAEVRRKVEELRSTTDPHGVRWRCAFEHALATGASQPRDPALQSGSKGIVIGTGSIFRKPEPAAAPAAAPAPSRGPAGAAGTFASSCVRLVRAGPKGDGNWRFLNECGTDITLFWCFLSPERKGQCGYKGTWNVQAGRGWTTHSRDAIRWGACRGLNTGGLVGNDGATFHCNAGSDRTVAARTPPLGSGWTPGSAEEGGVAAGASLPQGQASPPAGRPAAGAGASRPTDASFIQAGCAPDEAAMQAYINEHNAIAPSVGFQQMNRADFMQRVWKPIGEMVHSLARLEEFVQQARKAEEFNRARMSRGDLIARRSTAQDVFMQKMYACLIAYRDSQGAATPPIAAAARSSASSAGEVQCERGFEELDRRTRAAQARLPQSGARPGLELLMWSTREAMRLIDGQCPGSERYRADREAYRQRYAEAERSCGQLSNTGTCEPRLP